MACVVDLVDLLSGRLSKWLIGFALQPNNFGTVSASDQVLLTALSDCMQQSVNSV